MSGNISDSDDLTTDAVPSPPRDDVKKEKSEEEAEEETININTRPKVTNTQWIPKSKTKTKKTAPTASATVINITNANGVHIGSNYNMYVNSKPQNNTQKEERVVTEAIKSLFKSTDSVTRKHLLLISPHLNEEWRMTARLLQYSDGQISQFYEDHIRTGIKEVIYRLLLDWIQNEGESATVGKLSSVLWETNQQDAVTSWAGSLKTNSQ